MKRISLALIALVLCACSPKTYEQADKDNDFEALVGDFKVYDACYEKSFKGDECDRWRVKDIAMPEYWPYPEVPAMKWPDAPKERVYKKGMKRAEYFEALCKSEAGEFIYKRVEADSIYQVRPRKMGLGSGDYRQRSPRYSDEDWRSGDSDSGFRTFQSMLRSPSTEDRVNTERGRAGYSKFEVPLSPLTEIPLNASSLYASISRQKPNEGDRVRIYESDASTESSASFGLRLRFTNRPESQFGYIWRGIRRPYDRELGISGTEVVVMDLRTNDIIGLHRGFVMAGVHFDGGITYTHDGEGFSACPNVMRIKGRHSLSRDTTGFLKEVVVSSNGFVPLWDKAREVANRRHVEAKAKDATFDLVKAYEASESSNQREFGYGRTYEQYLAWLRERGLPIDEYLAKKQATQPASPPTTDSK